jgi:hypothetical protein
MGIIILKISWFAMAKCYGTERYKTPQAFV